MVKKISKNKKSTKKAPKKKLSTRMRVQSDDRDGVFFLKLVLYMVLGAIWVKFDRALTLGPVVLNGVPVGLLVGLFFASQDKFQIDRKIEDALLLVMAILTFFLPAGIVI